MFDRVSSLLLEKTGFWLILLLVYLRSISTFLLCNCSSFFTYITFSCSIAYAVHELPESCVAETSPQLVSLSCVWQWWGICDLKYIFPPILERCSDVWSVLCMSKLGGTGGWVSWDYWIRAPCWCRSSWLLSVLQAEPQAYEPSVHSWLQMGLQNEKQKWKHDCKILVSYRKIRLLCVLFLPRQACVLFISFIIH